MPERGGGAGTAPEPSRRGRLLVAVALGVALAVSVVGTLALRGALPPELPRDLEHAAANGGRDAGACLGCHARGTVLDRPAGHTGRQDCWSCHLVP